MKEFITQIGNKEGPIVVACDQEHAQQQVGPGVAVLGELILTVRCLSMTEEKANTIVRGLAESYFD